MKFTKTIEGEYIDMDKIRKFYVILGANYMHNVLAEYDNGDTACIQSFKTKVEAQNFVKELFK